ncbi:MAG: DNA repair protein RecO [Johnsonella sp.]|nr:DNA repair protein RecO [Johnsonella sp.]
MKDFAEFTGMVIKSIPIGEYDKRITVLTRERGKLFAFVRGARRQGSPLLACTLPFAYGKFKFYEGRNSFSLHSAKMERFFEEISQDIQKACYGSYFLEFTDYYAREFLREQDMLKLLYISLLALSRPSIPMRLTRRIFELRMMVINGEYDSQPKKLRGETARYTWHYIIHSPLEKLYTFAIKQEVLEEIESCMDDMMGEYIDKEMNSLKILKAIIT